MICWVWPLFWGINCIHWHFLLKHIIHFFVHYLLFDLVPRPWPPTGHCHIIVPSVLQGYHDHVVTGSSAHSTCRNLSYTPIWCGSLFRTGGCNWYVVLPPLSCPPPFPWQGGYWTKVTFVAVRWGTDWWPLPDMISASSFPLMPPHTSACVFPSLLCKICGSVASLRLPGMDTLSGRKWTVVKLQVRWVISVRLTGRALVKNWKKILLNSVWMSQTRASGMVGW